MWCRRLKLFDKNCTKSAIAKMLPRWQFTLQTCFVDLKIGLTSFNRWRLTSMIETVIVCKSSTKLLITQVKKNEIRGIQESLNCLIYQIIDEHWSSTTVHMYTEIWIIKNCSTKSQNNHKTTSEDFKNWRKYWILKGKKGSRNMFSCFN